MRTICRYAVAPAAFFAFSRYLVRTFMLLTQLLKVDARHIDTQPLQSTPRRIDSRNPQISAQVHTSRLAPVHPSRPTNEHTSGYPGATASGLEDHGRTYDRAVQCADQRLTLPQLRMDADENQHLLADMGVVPVILALLKQHMAHACVTDSACSVLQNIFVTGLYLD